MKNMKKEANMAALKKLIEVMRGHEKESWKDVLDKKEPKEEMDEEEEECEECKDGSCPECKKKGGIGIIIAVGKGKPAKE